MIKTMRVSKEINKKLINELKEILKKEGATVEGQLKKFAKKDKEIPGDWDTLFPDFDGKSRETTLEEAADEVEEYSTLLPIEYALETKLKNINLALKKIKNGKYGICEKCDKKIEEERLKAYPEARLCLKCKPH